MMQLPKIDKDFEGHYVIPEGVTAIEGYAFAKFTALKSLEIPNSVTNIADYAFSDCVNLVSIVVAPDNPNYCSEDNVLYNKDKTKIIYCARGIQEHYEIPNSVTRIGFQAFKNCSFIKCLIIPNSVIEIDDGVFTGCTNLISLTVASDNPKYCSEDNVLYNKDKTELIGCIVSKQGLFEIPNSVTKIGKCAFWKCAGITNINSHNSVTEIGDWAFRDCTGLISIEISNSVTKIGHVAFSECKSLMSIELPNSIIEIGDFAFEGCTCIKDIKIPNSVTKIGEFAFTDCTALTCIKIPNSVTRIGDYAFGNCNNLEKLSVDINNLNYCSDNNVLFNKDKSILIYCVGGKHGEYKIPNSVTKIEEFAFSGCVNLTSIEIPNSVKEIKYLAFNECTCLSSLTVAYDNPNYRSENNVLFNKEKTILLYCVGSKQGMYVIPNSVTKLEDYAFSCCTGLISIVLPNSNIKIGSSVFEGCKNLSEIHLLNEDPDAYEVTFNKKDIKDITLYVPIGTKSVYCHHPVFSIFKNVEEESQILNNINKNFKGHYGIPDGVTKIEDEAFLECRGLTSVEIPDSVTSIGKWAFFGCTGLTSIEIPNSVTNIGVGAFNGCANMLSFIVASNNPNYCSEDNVLYNKDKSIIIYCARSKQGQFEIPNSVTNIGFQAFANCSFLKSIIIPNSVIKIEDGVFEGCTNLISLTVASDNPKYCTEDNVLYNKDKTILICCSRSKQGRYKIPASVKTIEAYAFYACSNLKNIVIPNSVTEIRYSTFEGCTNLTNIEIPNSVKRIEEFAFQNCTELISIIIPDSVISIENCAFSGCKDTTIFIPSSVMNIGVHAFDGSSGISIVISDSATYIENCAFEGCKWLKSIVIPNSVNSIGEYAFGECVNLVSIVVPYSVVSIGYGAFSLCKGLSSIVIPNSVTNIEDNTFYGCTSLNSVVIPNSVTSIGNSAFSGCTSLMSIVIPNSVNNIGNHAFYGCISLTSITIPNSLEEIGMRVFHGCTILNEIHIFNEDPNTIEVEFDEEDIQNITLYIPYGSEQAYRNHPEFSKFKEVKTEHYKEQ